MYVGYGTPGVDIYKHDVAGASITFSVRKLYSRWRGYLHALEYRMTVQGELTCNHPTDTLSEQIDDLIAAYAPEGKRLALYRDDDSVTQHVMPGQLENVFTLDGPKIEFRSWPKGDIGEYASIRTYLIAARAVYALYDANDAFPGVIRYQETFRWQGNGLASFWLVPDQAGNYTQRIRYPGTSMMLYQEGYSIGQNVRISPLSPVYPTALHNDKVVYEPVSPEFGTGELIGNYTEYHTRWVYPMELPPGYFNATQPRSK